jgi:hypothetical protein
MKGALMPNQPRLDLVRKAICSGIFGQVEWKDDAFSRVVDDAEMEGLHPHYIRQLLRQFVQGGGVIDIRDEKREQWLAEDPDNPHWYRAIVPVEMLESCNEIFVEMVLSEPIHGF